MSWLRALAACFLLLFAAPAMAQEPSPYDGWWRASVEHAGEREDFYLYLETRADGRRLARFNIPLIAMEALFSRYEIAESELRLTDAHWTLAIEDEGRALAGTIPADLAPVHQLNARFERSDAPAPIPDPPSRETPPAPLWRVEAGAPIWAGLTYDPRTDRLIAATEAGRVLALWARDGRQVWSHDLGGAIRATPTLHQGRLYVATDAALVALNARTGRELWRAPFGSQRAERLPIADQNSRWDHYSASAAIDDNFIAIPSRDGCVHALDARNGARRWRTCTEDVLTGTPALTHDAVLFGGMDGNAYALARATGGELWRRNLSMPLPRDAVIANGAVLFGSRTYDLSALDAQTGEPAWTRYFWFSWVDAAPALADGVIYIGASDGLQVQALDARNGARIWRARVPGWSWGRPGIGRETIYAGAVGGQYSGVRRGGLVAIDRVTGERRWIIPSEEAAEGETYGFAAAPAVAGDRVFAADLTGAIFAFRD